jgi:hypothetical protein
MHKARVASRLEGNTMESMPTPIPAKRGKYDWDELSDKGWIFVAKDDSLVTQADSIRNSAYAAGVKVRVQRAEHEGELGFLVTPR